MELYDNMDVVLRNEFECSYSSEDLDEGLVEDFSENLNEHLSKLSSKDNSQQFTQKIHNESVRLGAEKEASRIINENPYLNDPFY